MRVLFDIVHPAHVHFYRHMIATLVERGDAVSVVSRPKDVTAVLLDSFGIEHRQLGSGPQSSRFGQAFELLSRDAGIAREVARFKPDVICTRSPAGVQVARAVPGVIGLFDTDDGPAAGIHYQAAARFAHVITTPDCLTADIGPKHRPYRSYKALAYLHPDRFTPSPTIHEELGLDPSEPYSVVRLVAMKASHDHGEAGLDAATLRSIIDKLGENGRVFVSGEAGVHPELAHLALPVAADRMHHVLAAASLYVGDSQTMAIEAAILGVPTVHCSSWARRLDNLIELEDRYALLESFLPRQVSEVLESVSRLSSDPLASKTAWSERRGQLLADKVDLTSWYLDLLDELT